MRTRRGLTPIVVVGLGTLLLAMPWSTDMERGPAAGLLDNPLPPSEGALSIHGERPMLRDEADTMLTSPLDRSPLVLEKGKTLFDIYCAVCHGKTGEGDGPVGTKYSFAVPSLRADFIKARSDGYLYGTIRHGGFIMPGYAEVMTPDERWMVVQYVRSLQGQ